MPHKLEKIRAAGGVRRRAPAQTAFYSNARESNDRLKKASTSPHRGGSDTFRARLRKVSTLSLSVVETAPGRPAHDEGHIQPLAHHLLIGADEVADLGGRGLQLIYQDERPAVFGGELAAQLHEPLLGAFGRCRPPL